MQAFGRAVGLMNGAGVVWTFALTFLICADIFGRTVLDRPIRGVAEIVSLSIVTCRRTLCTSTIGDSAVTVTVSCSVPTFMSAFTVAVNEPSITTPVRR